MFTVIQKRSSINIFPQAGHYMSKNQKCLASHSLVTPDIEDVMPYSAISIIFPQLTFSHITYYRTYFLGIHSPHNRSDLLYSWQETSVQ